MGSVSQSGIRSIGTILKALIFATLLLSNFIENALAQADIQVKRYAVEGDYIITPRLMSAHTSKNIRDDHLRRHGVREVEVVGSKVLRVQDEARGVSASEVKVSEVSENDEFCIKMLKSGVAVNCSPNYIVSASAVPNESNLSALWGLSGPNGIHAPEAWDVTTGSDSVVVAIIDTGIAYNHPDLAANVWTNTGEVAGNGLDDDGNGIVDDVHGYNAVKNTGNPFDDNGHGTHVSGTIGARGNNGMGVVGVNWNVKLMGLKFLNASGSGTLADAIKAIDYMVEMKGRGVNIKISNNSWGGGGFSQPLADAISRARAAGILFVAAAGNEANDNDANPTYPASFEIDNVISVGAIDSAGNLASFSNYGQKRVQIAAPGVGILSTVPGGQGYATLSGTSMAAPHVSGALAMLFAREPGLSIQEARQRLIRTANPSVALQGIVEKGKILNVNNLVRNVEPEELPEPEPVNCNYVMQNGSYAPSATVSSRAVIQRSDEFNYTTVNLPFLFPFFDRQVARVVVSPNGVVYLGSAPAGMDYQNGTSAPEYSIAVLHSDLIAKEDGEGVRVETSADQVVIYYQAKHYNYPGGYAQAWLTLRRDGLIKIEHNFSNSGAQGYLQKNATVGISGSGSASKLTYSYKSPKVVAGGAVQYVSTCGAPSEESVTLSNLEIVGKDRKNKAYNYVVPGAKAEISIRSSGASTAVLTPILDGKACDGSMTVELAEGDNRLSTIIPRNVNKRFAVRFESHDLKRGVNVRSRFGAPAGRTSRSSRATKRAHLKSCMRLLAKVQLAQ